MLKTYFKLIELSRQYSRAKLCRYHFTRMVALYGCEPLLYQLVDTHIKASELGNRVLCDMVFFGIDRYRVRPDEPNYHFIKTNYIPKYPKNNRV